MNSFRKEDKCWFIIKFLSAVQMNVLLNEGVVGCQFEKKTQQKLFCSSTAHQILDILAADAQLVQPDRVIVDLLTRDLAKHQTTNTETALRTVT